MTMKIKMGALKAGSRREFDTRWDNVVEFTDLEPTPVQWRSLRLIISRSGGRVAHLDPIRVVILDCWRRGAKSHEVRALVADVRALHDQWEGEEYDAKGE